MINKYVFEGQLTVEKDDGGMALIGELPDTELVDPHMFVRLQSWDKTKVHPVMSKLNGALVRITVEVLEYPLVTGDK